MRLNQIELFNAILRNVARQAKDQGLPEPAVIPRQVNAVIAAANMIVDAYTQDFIEAEPNRGIDAWLASDEVGLSSSVMCNKLTGRHYAQQAHPAETAHPLDPADFGRCLALLNAQPKLRENLPSMAEVSPHWAALVWNWDRLEESYNREKPTGRAPETYETMKQILDGVQA